MGQADLTPDTRSVYDHGPPTAGDAGQAFPLVFDEEDYLHKQLVWKAIDVCYSTRFDQVVSHNFLYCYSFADVQELLVNFQFPSDHCICATQLVGECPVAVWFHTLSNVCVTLMYYYIVLCRVEPESHISTVMYATLSVKSTSLNTSIVPGFVSCDASTLRGTSPPFLLLMQRSHSSRSQLASHNSSPTCDLIDLIRDAL